MQMKDFFKKNGLCFLEGKTGRASCRILSKVRKSIKKAKRSRAVRQCSQCAVWLSVTAMPIYLHSHLHYSASLHLNRLLNWTPPPQHHTSVSQRQHLRAASCTGGFLEASSWFRSNIRNFDLSFVDFMPTSDVLLLPTI